MIEKTVGVKGPHLTFQLNGGMEVEYSVRLGLMLFTVTEDNWTNQNDELVKTSRSTLIRY